MNFDVKTIQKYKRKSLPQLMSKATEVFNAYIRKRDKHLPCISCSQYKALQAGHFYDANKYPMLRYKELNVNGECLYCNYYSGDHLIGYRANLISKIGEDNVIELDMIAKYNKRITYKWSRIELIEIIEDYKQKCKEL